MNQADRGMGGHARLFRGALLAVLALAAATRLGYALSKSLVLDEFHSYFHASTMGAAPGGLFGALFQDNHPPLSFWIIGTAKAAFGNAEWVLRSPALLFGLLEIALVARLAGALARGGTGPRAAVPVVAAALLAASSLHFDYGTQARMYALHSLSVTAVLVALVALHRGAGRGAGALFVLGSVVSFHTHYFGLQYLGLLCLTFVAISGTAGLRKILAPAGLALLLCLPWALTGFRAQLSHGLAPGGDDVGLGALAQSFMQLFFHNVRFGGPTGKFAFAAGAALVLVIAFRGLMVAIRGQDSRGAGWLVGTAAFGLPPVAWALAALLPRAGYTWHYVLPSAAPMAVFFAVGARGRVFGPLGGVAVALAAALTGLHLTRPATEDFRGAVAYALGEHAAAAADGVESSIVSVEWQPALFPQGQPYDYYAPKLAAFPPPRAPMLEGEFTVLDPAALLEKERVILIRRSLPGDQFLLRKLIERFGAPKVEPFGFGLDVRTFDKARQ